MHFDETRLAEVLVRDRSDHETAQYCVAYSGGLDSTVLLHALAQLRVRWPAVRVRATHIDHGLDPASPEWARHCESCVSQIGIELTTLEVDVRDVAEIGVEAAARKARYQALREQLGPGEILVTAHHADDQLETFLLQLLRGSGVAGLAAMPAVTSFGHGHHARPLLGFDRAALGAYGEARKLRWLDDPANRELRYDRAYLRHTVLPLLTRRWPAAATSTLRTTRHCAEALDLCNDLAAQDLTTLEDSGALNCVALSTFSPGRIRNVLRYWIRCHGKRVPSSKKLNAVVVDVLNAAPDSTPVVTWAGTEIRRHRNRLYIMSPLAAAGGLSMHWSVSDRLALGAGCGTLGTEQSRGEGIAAEQLNRARVTVQFRTGGERLTPKGHRQSKALKNLFQEQGILPWMRDRVPLICLDGELAAVADICVASQFCADTGEPGVKIVWTDHPPVR